MKAGIEIEIEIAEKNYCWNYCHYFEFISASDAKNINGHTYCMKTNDKLPHVNTSAIFLKKEYPMDKL